MATFLEKLLKNASTNVSEGIQKRIDDGTFNRMAEGVGKGLSSMMGGMATVVGMAETAFAKLKEKATSKDDGGKDFNPSNYYQQPAAEPQPVVTEETVRDVAGYVSEAPQPQRHPVDISEVDNNFMQRLIEKYDMEGDDYAIYLESIRLTAQIGIFFAACDGNFTQREFDCIKQYKEMTYEYCDRVEYEDVNGNEGCPIDEIFDDIDHPYAIEDIIALTHHLIDPMGAKERRECLEYINELAQQVVEADDRDDTVTEDYYDRWRREFMI